MIQPTRASLRAHTTTLLALCLACFVLALVAGAAAAEGAIVYQPETLAQFEQQLAGRQIRTVTINKRVRSLRVTLKNGAYVLAKYAPHQEPALASQLRAKHVPVSVLTPTAAIKETKGKPVHHKLRYIAAGILVLVVVVVGLVLFIDRKRKAARD
jgi:ATP-dependent Zn protease